MHHLKSFGGTRSGLIAVLALLAAVIAAACKGGTPGY